jgi:hypothetical protein
MSETDPAGRSPGPGGAEQLRWGEALALAEALVASTAQAWEQETQVLAGVYAGLRWYQETRMAVAIVAAAIYRAAGRQPTVSLRDLAVCASAQFLQPEHRHVLLEKTPVDTDLLRRWRNGGYHDGQLHTARLRAWRALACAHPGAATAGTRCPGIGERIGATATGQFVWDVLEVREEIVHLGPDGVGPWRCGECAAHESWMIAKPLGRWWWMWVLCRCGQVQATEYGHDPHVNDLPWQHLSPRGFAGLAASRGYGPFGELEPEDSLSDPVATVTRVLPPMSVGGDPHWRLAARVAASTLCAEERHANMPRHAGGSLNDLALYRAVSLAALIVYVLSDATGLAPQSVDLSAALAAGPQALHAALAATLPDLPALAQWREQPMSSFRARHWPMIGHGHTQASRIDPAVTAWASLAHPPHIELPGRQPLAQYQPSPDAHAYREAYGALLCLMAPA